MAIRATLGFMNPIALIEVTGAARSAALGALATDPVVRERNDARGSQPPGQTTFPGATRVRPFLARRIST
jgi:hypothetical protein